MKPIPLTLRQIEYILATADCGSTAAAARALNVSQPSVSLALSKVEDHFGRALFTRAAGQGVTLTSFGVQKLGTLRRLVEDARQVLDVDTPEHEVVHLGVFSTLGPRYAPSLVRRFQARYPNAKIQLHEANLLTLADWLDRGQIDVALMYDFGLPSDLRILPLAEIRPYGLVSGGHRLAGRSTVNITELLQDPLILMNLPHSRSYFLTLAQMHGINPEIAHETSSVEMLRSMVANDLGVGLLATDVPHDRAYDSQPLVRLPLTGDLAPHRIALAQSKRLRARPAVADFCKFAAEALADPSSA
jgi:DNA-binding transcriptional LysR family regulator